MLRELLKDYHIILASGSPRRKRFFELLDLDFEVDVREVEEIYPPELKGPAITDYLAQLKASAFTELADNAIVVTSDTIVWKDNQAIGKPANEAEARSMLRNLSGTVHEVYSSVCFTSKKGQRTVNDRTKVWFKELTNKEIEHYISNYKPFDKAGSYGIQDWLGYVAIDRLEGCFFNVMGLPTRLVYKSLVEIANEGA